MCIRKLCVFSGSLNKNWQHIFSRFSAGGLLNQSTKQRKQRSLQQEVTVDAEYVIIVQY